MAVLSVNKVHHFGPHACVILTAGLNHTVDTGRNLLASMITLWDNVGTLKGG